MFVARVARCLSSAAPLLPRAALAASNNVQMSRPVHTSGRFGADARAAFDNAQKALKTLTQDPGNEVKLKLYALFKQATLGKCSGKRPGMMDFVGRAKYDAWAGLGDMNADEAMRAYAAAVDELKAAEGGAPAAAATEPAAGGASKMPGNEIVVTKKDGVCHIRLNRPAKKNALTREMYNFIADSLRDAAEDDNVKLTVFSGAGDYYCSGNDLGNFMEAATGGDIAKVARESKELLLNYVSAYIDHPKALVALVHGPAIGVSVTVLGLFDLVLASDKATFQTPFASLGQSPEGASAFVFPRIMGPNKAAEVLLFGKKLTAEEACRRNLVTDVIPADDFETESWRRIHEYAKLPPQSLRYCKEMLRMTFRPQLHKINQAECDRLEERWQSDECANAVMAFFSSRAKM